jgi:glycosyltransferase involved in cell wall biosynthesis
MIKRELLLPRADKNLSKPFLSIVIPALNEQITIGEFIDWCHEGISATGVTAEILIVDSSDDNTPEIALAKNARVLRVPRLGLGQAYLDAIPYIRGEYVILGDCDLTYDFRELEPFINSFRSGSEFVMGSRFAGTIERGAMPKLHQYFGTPLTTGILNLIYRSRFTDIHCGMRGLSKEALRQISLTSSGWEYASEMVLKASRLNLKIDEVPVKFYKDREGRLSHHKRSGFLSPWKAGWVNLKVMLVFSGDTFLLKPSAFISLVGFILVSASLTESLTNYDYGFGTTAFLFGCTLINIGVSLFQTGIITRLIHGLRRGVEEKIIRIVTYNFGMSLAILSGLVAISFASAHLFGVATGAWQLGFSKLAGASLMAGVFAAQAFSFTIILELIRRNQKLK